PYYNVVDYIEPMAGNQAALGLDVSQDPVIMGALRQAGTRGGAAATGLLRLAQNLSGRPGLALVMPVRGAGGEVIGDTATVIDLQTLARTALARAAIGEERGIQVRLYQGKAAQP